MNADPSRADFKTVRNRVEHEVATPADAKLLLAMVMDYRKRIFLTTCYHHQRMAPILSKLNDVEHLLRMANEAIDPSGHGCHLSACDVATAVLDPERIAHLRLRVAEAWTASLRYQPPYAVSRWRRWCDAAKRVFERYVKGARP